MIEYNIYKNGCMRMLTMSFDDGQINDRRLIELLNKYGIKATFNINNSYPGDEWHISKDEIKQVYEGHEIAVHTANHPWLDNLSPTTIINEILDNRKFLEEASGRIVRGMAYPFGPTNEEVISIARHCGVVYSRAAESTYKFDLPRDFMEWHPTCHFKQGKDVIPQFINNLDSAWATGVLYIWGHSFELDTEEKWENFEKLCEYVANKEQIWYATNIEIYDYITAQRALQFTADESMVYNPTQTNVWIRVDKKPYKIGAGETVVLK